MTRIGLAVLCLIALISVMIASTSAAEVCVRCPGAYVQVAVPEYVSATYTYGVLGSTYRTTVTTDSKRPSPLQTTTTNKAPPQRTTITNTPVQKEMQPERRFFGRRTIRTRETTRERPKLFSRLRR